MEEESQRKAITLKRSVGLIEMLLRHYSLFAHRGDVQGAEQPELIEREAMDAFLSRNIKGP